MAFSSRGSTTGMVSKAFLTATLPHDAVEFFSVRTGAARGYFAAAGPHHELTLIDEADALESGASCLFTTSRFGVGVAVAVPCTWGQRRGALMVLGKSPECLRYVGPDGDHTSAPVWYRARKGIQSATICGPICILRTSTEWVALIADAVTCREIGAVPVAAPIKRVVAAAVDRSSSATMNANGSTSDGLFRFLAVVQQSPTADAAAAAAKGSSTVHAYAFSVSPSTFSVTAATPLDAAAAHGAVALSPATGHIAFADTAAKRVVLVDVTSTAAPTVVATSSAANASSFWTVGPAPITALAFHQHGPTPVVVAVQRPVEAANNEEDDEDETDSKRDLGEDGPHRCLVLRQNAPKPRIACTVPVAGRRSHQAGSAAGSLVAVPSATGTFLLSAGPAVYAIVLAAKTLSATSAPTDANSTVSANGATAAAAAAAGSSSSATGSSLASRLRRANAAAAADTTAITASPSGSQADTKKTGPKTPTTPTAAVVVAVAGASCEVSAIHAQDSPSTACAAFAAAHAAEPAHVVALASTLSRVVAKAPAGSHAHPGSAEAPAALVSALSALPPLVVAALLQAPFAAWAAAGTSALAVLAAAPRHHHARSLSPLPPADGPFLGESPSSSQSLPPPQSPSSPRGVPAHFHGPGDELKYVLSVLYFGFMFTMRAGALDTARICAAAFDGILAAASNHQQQSNSSNGSVITAVVCASCTDMAARMAAVLRAAGAWATQDAGKLIGYVSAHCTAPSTATKEAAHLPWQPTRIHTRKTTEISKTTIQLPLNGKSSKKK